MAKIDIDLTTNVDIYALEGDSFELDLSIANTNGSTYDFTDKNVYFTIRDSDGKPIAVLSSNYTQPHHITARNGGATTSEEEQEAKAVSNLLKCDIGLFTFTTFAEDINLSYRANAEGFMYKQRAVGVTINTEGLSLYIQSQAFRLPSGSYSYDMKIASDLNDVYKGVGYSVRVLTDSFYKNSSTWMKGKFIVNKN